MDTGQTKIDGGREEKSALGNRRFLQQIGKESGDEIWIVTLLFC